MATTQSKTVSQREVDEGLEVTLTADIDIESAEAARLELLETIKAAPEGASIRLELSGPAATTPALQLALATRRTLSARDGFAGFGQRAAAQLEAACASQAAPAFNSVRGGA